MLLLCPRPPPALLSPASKHETVSTSSVAPWDYCPQPELRAAYHGLSRAFSSSLLTDVASVLPPPPWKGPRTWLDWEGKQMTKDTREKGYGRCLLPPWCCLLWSLGNNRQNLLPLLPTTPGSRGRGGTWVVLCYKPYGFFFSGIIFLECIQSTQQSLKKKNLKIGCLFA